jgi:hypothetical protein
VFTIRSHSSRRPTKLLTSLGKFPSSRCWCGRGREAHRPLELTRWIGRGRAMVRPTIGASLAANVWSRHRRVTCRPSIKVRATKCKVAVLPATRESAA